MAKQAATLDSLSGGRLVLGVAVGGREDDYEVSGVDFHTRGKRFDAMLAEWDELWRGDRVGPAHPARPADADPRRLRDATYERAARYGDGWSLGGGTPDAYAGGMEKMRAAWKAAGRDGEPRGMSLAYYALGDGAREAAQGYLATTTASSATTPRRSPTARRPTPTRSAATSRASRPRAATS